jgi:hypothetical protein
VDDAEHMPFYILFGVIVAAMLAGIFIMQYNRQLEARVDEQAQALANDLARISFTAFSREQPSFLLPRNLGGSDYELSVDENSSTFIVRIKAGKQSGTSYYSTANVSLSEDNFNPVPGGSVYFQRRGDNVVVSSSPITAPPENLLPPVTATPPEFYNLENNKVYAKVATAIAAAYFSVLENFVRENKPIKDENNNPLDVSGYENGENVLVQIGYRGGENIFGVEVSFEYENYENTENIGKVINAWIVTDITINLDNLGGATTCPSVENAHVSGWLYSREEALDYLRSRTWMSDGTPVVVPAGARVDAAAATTEVSIYPTYRVTFDGYVIYYRAMPWYWKENQPGFVFQSKPPLEAVA